MDKTKVKLRICDIDCTITSDDNEEYVRTLGDEIGRSISAVLKKNDRISLSMAAIITAMTYCDESAKAKAELAELKTVEKSITNDYNRIKQTADTAKAEVTQLRNELQVLHALLAENKDFEQLPALKEALQLKEKPTTREPLTQDEQDMVFRCINGKPTYVPKEQAQAEEPKFYDTPTPKPATVEDAHTLEELCDSIHAAAETDRMLDNPLEGVPVTAPANQNKHGKQNRHQKKQQKMAQKSQEKEGPRHIPPYSPVQRAEHPVPEVLTGNFTRPKSPFEPELPSDQTFMSYFEKK